MGSNTAVIIPAPARNVEIIETFSLPRCFKQLTKIRLSFIIACVCNPIRKGNEEVHGDNRWHHAYRLGFDFGCVERVWRVNQ